MSSVRMKEEGSKGGGTGVKGSLYLEGGGETLVHRRRIKSLERGCSLA